MFKLLIVDATNRAHVMARANLEAVADRFMREVRRTSQMVGGAVPVLCWDHPTGSEFRKKLLPAYKSKRKHEPQIEEAVKDCMAEASQHYCCWFDENFEADDLIATLVGAVKDWPIVIHSSDRDMYTLLDGGVRLQITTPTFERERIKWMGPDQVYAETGIRAEQWMDFYCLQGDTSDNVPGVPKIGKKMAETILQAYPSVAEAVAVGKCPPGVQAFRWKALLEAYTDGTWDLMREVLQKRDDVPIPPNVEEAIALASALPGPSPDAFEESAAASPPVAIAQATEYEGLGWGSLPESSESDIEPPF